MITHKVKATITEKEREGKPTIRLFLTEYQKQQLLLQNGKQPIDLFTIIIL